MPKHKHREGSSEGVHKAVGDFQFVSAPPKKAFIAAALINLKAANMGKVQMGRAIYKTVQ